MGEYQVGRITETQTINFAQPLFEEDGTNLIGVVFAALHVDALDAASRAALDA